MLNTSTKTALKTTTTKTNSYQKGSFEDILQALDIKPGRFIQLVKWSKKIYNGMEFIDKDRKNFYILYKSRDYYKSDYSLERFLQYAEDTLAIELVDKERIITKIKEFLPQGLEYYLYKVENNKLLIKY